MRSEALREVQPHVRHTSMPGVLMDAFFSDLMATSPNLGCLPRKTLPKAPEPMTRMKLYSPTPSFNRASSAPSFRENTWENGLRLGSYDALTLGDRGFIYGSSRSARSVSSCGMCGKTVWGAFHTIFRRAILEPASQATRSSPRALSLCKKKT